MINYLFSRFDRFLENWSPIRLRGKIRSVRQEGEFNAFSVRQLIAQRARLFALIEFIGRIARFENGQSLGAVASKVRGTESQFYQDILALLLSQGKRGGYFVEFGACDGVMISNTYILEKSFGWRGILAEPGREWHKGLRENRACHLETMCVWSKTGERIPFYEVDQNHDQSSAEAGNGRVAPCVRIVVAPIEPRMKGART